MSCMEKGILLAGLGAELVGWLNERLSVPVRDGGDLRDGADPDRRSQRGRPGANGAGRQAVRTHIYCLPASAYRAALRMLTDELRVDDIQIQPIDREELALQAAQLLDLRWRRAWRQARRRRGDAARAERRCGADPAAGGGGPQGRRPLRGDAGPLAARVFLLNRVPHGVLLDIADVELGEDGEPGMRDFSLLAAFAGRRPAVPVLATMRHCSFADRVEAARSAAGSWIAA